MSERPVVVVGAGPIGLAAATELLERGLEPLVVERGRDVEPLDVRHDLLVDPEPQADLAGPHGHHVGVRVDPVGVDPIQLEKLRRGDEQRPGIGCLWTVACLDRVPPGVAPVAGIGLLGGVHRHVQVDHRRTVQQGCQPVGVRAQRLDLRRGPDRDEFPDPCCLLR